MTAPETQLAVGGEAVSLRDDELDCLLDALAALELRAAADVRDEIEALRLAGSRTIRLLPTEAELGAVRLAVAAAEEQRPVGSALDRLARLCDPVAAETGDRC